MSTIGPAIHSLYRSDSPEPAFLCEMRAMYRPEIIEVDQVEPPLGYVRWLQTIDQRLHRISSRLPQRSDHLAMVVNGRSKVSEALIIDLRGLPTLEDIPDDPAREGALWGSARRKASERIQSIKQAIETINQRADFDPDLFLAVVIPTWRNPLSLGV